MILIFRVTPPRVETMLRHRTAEETRATMDIPETDLRPMQETEIEGLVVGVQIVNVAKGCRIGNASCTVAEATLERDTVSLIQQFDSSR